MNFFKLLDYLNRIPTLLIILFLFSYLFFGIFFKNKINVKYENIEVCGKVKKFVNNPHCGGYTNKSMFFESEIYGFIDYGEVGKDYKDSYYKIDFLGLENKKRVCFLVNKPIGSKEWSNSYTIVGILKIEDL